MIKLNAIIEDDDPVPNRIEEGNMSIGVYKLKGKNLISLEELVEFLEEEASHRHGAVKFYLSLLIKRFKKNIKKINGE